MKLHYIGFILLLLSLTSLSDCRGPRGKSSSSKNNAKKIEKSSTKRQPFFKGVDEDKTLLKKGGTAYRNVEITRQAPNSKVKFIPTTILEKLRRVGGNLNEFMKEFKPNGVHTKHVKANDGHLMKSFVFHSLEKEHRLTDASHGSHDNTVNVIEQQDISCKPRPKLVPVPADTYASSIFWPSCVELNQCGGCCPADHFECVPKALTNKSTTVFRIPLDGSSSPVPHQVYMMHHSKCRCQCRVRPNDCSPTQIYDENNCQCLCNRKEETCPRGKQWSHSACKCVCAYLQTCPKRWVWDENRCRCRCKRSKCKYPLKLDPNTCRCLYVEQNHRRMRENPEHFFI